MTELEELREENERLKTEIDRLRLALSGRTQGYDAESYKAGMLAAAEMREVVYSCCVCSERIKAKAEEVK